MLAVYILLQDFRKRLEAINFLGPHKIYVMISEADNNYPLSLLWQSVIECVQNFPICFVAKLVERFNYSCNSLFPVVSGKLLNIFKNDHWRHFFLKDSNDFKKKRSAHVVEPETISNDAERLAWKTSAKHIMIRDFRSWNFRNVSVRGNPEIRGVRLFCWLVNFTRQKTAATVPRRCDMESANTGKKVYKGKFAHTINQLRF